MESDHFNEFTVARLIERVPGFEDLYADSGMPGLPAPRHRANVKFNEAVELMDDEDLAAIREYDRSRNGVSHSG